jgi:hypothetical protein
MSPYLTSYFGKVFDSNKELYNFLVNEMKIKPKKKNEDLFEFLLELSIKKEPNFKGEIWFPNAFNGTDKIFFGKMVTIEKLNNLDDWETMQKYIDSTSNNLKESWIKEQIPILDPKMYIFADE